MTATTKEYVDENCMIGSANAEFVPCILEGGSGFSKFIVVEEVRNTGSDDYYLKYVLPLPTNRGGLSLYVNEVKVLLSDADVNDYLDMIKVIGITYSSVRTLDQDLGEWKSAQEAGGSFTAVDCSGDDIVAVTLAINASTADEVDVRGVLLKCYYN